MIDLSSSKCGLLRQILELGPLGGRLPRKDICKRSKSESERERESERDWEIEVAASWPACLPGSVLLELRHSNSVGWTKWL